VADELNMNVMTLKNWMKGAADPTRGDGSGHAKRPEDWSLEERVQALQQSRGLGDEALNARCHERGLFAHHRSQWRVCAGRRRSRKKMPMLKNRRYVLGILATRSAGFSWTFYDVLALRCCA
jgi:hypothetical protein